MTINTMTINVVAALKLHTTKTLLLVLRLSTCVLWSTAAFSATTEHESPRWITTDANATELVLALTQRRYLVAVDVTSKGIPAVNELPNVGYHRNLSAEGLLSLNPSLIIGSEDMGPAPVMSSLSRNGVTLVQLPPPASYQQLVDNIQTLAAQIPHRRDNANSGNNTNSTTLLKQLSSHQDRLKESPLKGLRVAFVLASEPGKIRLAGTGTGGSAFIHLLGANNIAGFQGYQNVSNESMLALQPDIILIAARDTRSSAEDFLAENPILNMTPAGKSKHVMTVDASTLVAGLSLSAFTEALRLVDTLSPSLSTSLPSSLSSLSTSAR
jgi:iron complex transport system substrate-binding protein